MRTKFLAVLGSVALGVASLSAQSSQTISGFVSDAHCAAAHSAPGAKATKCAQSCIKGGSDAVLVSDGKVYKLKGKADDVKALAGQNVTVTGTVDGDTVTVDAVAAAKS